MLIASPILALASCSEVLREPTIIKSEINKSALGFNHEDDTIEGSGYQVNNKLIFDNRNKIFDGDISLFNSVNDISNLRAKVSSDDETKWKFLLL